MAIGHGSCSHGWWEISSGGKIRISTDYSLQIPFQGILGANHLGPWIICNVHLIKDVHPGIVVQKDFDQLCRERSIQLLYLVIFNFIKFLQYIGWRRWAGAINQKTVNFLNFFGPFQGMVLIHL